MRKSLIIIPLAFLFFFITEYLNAQDTELDKSLRGRVLLGNIDSVKSLIKAGIDVNKRFDMGASKNVAPLFLAVMMGHSDIAKLLINSGANPKMDFDGANLLHIAALYGGNEAIVDVLIRNGLDVNAKVKASRLDKDMTPLHIAAGKGNIKVAKALIKNGADITAKLFSYGYTPLHLAVKNKQIEFVKLLISSGADVNAKDNSEETPLDMAIYKNQKEMTDLLKKNGGKSGKE